MIPPAGWTLLVLAVLVALLVLLLVLEGTRRNP